MSRKAMLSLWGLYTYNDQLFSGIQIPKDPDDTPVFQLQDLIDNLLLDLAELEVLYTNPTFMQQAITAWSKKQFPVWQELADTMFYEYDPIENYYRRESWTDKDTYGHKIDSDLTHGHKITMDVEDTTVNSVTGYNGTTFADHDKSVFSNDDTETHSGKDTTNESHSGTDTATRDGWARGNIGVMATQQMIEMQRDVVKFNLMDYIIDDFKGRFMVLVY